MSDGGRLPRLASLIARGVLPGNTGRGLEGPLAAVALDAFVADVYR